MIAPHDMPRCPVCHRAKIRRDVLELGEGTFAICCDCDRPTSLDDPLIVQRPDGAVNGRVTREITVTGSAVIKDPEPFEDARIRFMKIAAALVEHAHRGMIATYLHGLSDEDRQIAESIIKSSSGGTNGTAADTTDTAD